MNQTVLTIEDDAAIRRGVVDALKYAGYQVREAGDAKVGRELALQHSYDLLLLDLVLPGGDGLSILKDVRAGRPTLPVIVLTARGDENDRVRGLNLGADDYVVKPFSVKELLARVQAVLRRTPERPADVHQVQVAGCQIDFSRREIRSAAGDRTELSEREAELVRYLVSNRGRVVTRDELLTHVWGLLPQGVTTRTIDMHIARLRDKLGDNHRDPNRRFLITVRGKGYMFAVAQADDLSAGLELNSEGEAAEDKASGKGRE